MHQLTLTGLRTFLEKFTCDGYIEFYEGGGVGILVIQDEEGNIMDQICDQVEELD